MMRFILLIGIIYFVFKSCDSGVSFLSGDAAKDRGYNDGYAVGYNETCVGRTTLIDGDFDNKHYKEAYRIGYHDGKEDCLNE